MTPLDAVIERLRGEQLCHRNDLTGCEVWTGDFDRGHRPTAIFGTVKVDVQEYTYQAASGEVVTRNHYIKLRCENSACILPAHMELFTKLGKTKEPLPEEDVAIVQDKYFERGFRIDVIAEDHQWSKPYVTKLVAEARSRRSVTS